MEREWRIDLSPLEWEDIMRDFSNSCAEQYFTKIPYKTWREMHKAMHDLRAVRVYWDNVSIDVVFDYHNQGSTSFYFQYYDCSFGDFLFKNYLYEQEQNEVMEKLKIENKYKYDSWYDDDPYHFVDWAKQDSGDSASSQIHTMETSISRVQDSLSTKADKSDFDTAQKTIEAFKEAYRAEMAVIAPMKNDVTLSVNEEKENNNMNGFKFDFGPANHNTVRMSMYGLAVKNKAGTWVSYDAKSGEIMDVDIFNFEGAQFIWRMPVAIKDIAIGDVVVHQGVPMFVVAIPEGGKVLTAVDPVVGERKDIMLARSPFGFNFATKVVNFLGDMFGGVVNADNPFGNMWMLMAMQGDGKTFDPNMLMPMMFANHGTMDPTMMMVFMAMGQNGGKMDMSTIFPLMWATQNMNKPVPHVCNCSQCNQ